MTAVTPNSFVTPQVVKTATCVLDTASTDIDDSPTTSVLLLTVGGAGGRLTRLHAIPRATVTASQIQCYLSKDGGTTKRFIDSVLVAAATVDNTHATSKTDFGYSQDNPLELEAGDRIYMATSVALAGGIVILATWEEY